MDNKTNLELRLEAILFASGKSVEIKNIKLALSLEEKEIEEVVEALNIKYELNNAFMIKRYENSYQLIVKKEYHEDLIKIVKIPKKPQLTDALIETLAIIAYKQPITKLEVEKIRAVSSEYSINKLIEYNLITEAGRLDAPGRPILFKTTREFLKSFDLRDLKDLPSMDESLVLKIKEEVKNELNYNLEDEKNE